MPNATLANDSILAKSAEKNGPLPAFPAATPEGAVWWSAYALATSAPSGAVKPRYLLAHRAGRMRKKVEPGINNATDPRAKLPPVLRIRF